MYIYIYMYIHTQKTHTYINNSTPPQTAFGAAPPGLPGPARVGPCTSAGDAIVEQPVTDQLPLRGGKHSIIIIIIRKK